MIKLFLKKIIGNFRRRYNEYYIGKSDLKRNFEKNKIKYNVGEKIRIAFLFQIPSFWPNWDSFYKECVKDEQFDVKIYLIKDEIKEHSQISNAEKFLNDNHIEYKNYSENDFERFCPHIVVIQTPYDYDHRSKKHQTAFYMSKGYRVIYIPYGIEIADTDNARKDHFFNPVVQNCWKVFTFSDTIKKDYERFGKLSDKVISLGHPKFDYIRHNKAVDYPVDILQKVKNKKIVLWHMHFPKSININGINVNCTPNIGIYIDFAKKIDMYSELFFIILPHPKFKESIRGRNFLSLCNKSNNAYIDFSDDYRNALCFSNCMITDRSSLMIEGAITKMPILYMENEKFSEPMTNAIKPLMESYYHGTNSNDIEKFLRMLINNEDRKYNERMNAIDICLNKCDGFSGYKIKEHVKSLLLSGE